MQSNINQTIVGQPKAMLEGASIQSKARGMSMVSDTLPSAFSRASSCGVASWLDGCWRPSSAYAAYLWGLQPVA